MSSLPDVDWLLGDGSYETGWFWKTLKGKGIRACLVGRKQRKKPVTNDTRHQNRRNRIEIMFDGLKDWRHVATRANNCPRSFLSAIAIAEFDIYWLGVPPRDPDDYTRA